MSSMQPGWYPDPFGRFARRYHDGRVWTEHVADQQGTQLSDAAPVSGQVAPPAAAAAGWQQPVAQPAPQPGWSQPGTTATYGQPGQQGWGQTATGYGAPSTAAGAGIGDFLGVILAGVGALLVLIGVLALDWFEEANRSDTSDFVDAIKDLGGDPNVLSSTWFSFGWIITILIALAAAGAALMKPTPIRIAAAAVGGLVFLWTMFGWLNLNAYISNDSNAAVLGTEGVSLGLGGWVTLIGLALGIAGAAIGGKLGATSTQTGPARAY